MTAVAGPIRASAVIGMLSSPGIVPPIRLDPLGHSGDRGGFEESAEGDVHASRFAKTRDDLRCQERVAAEVEEVVKSADTLQS